MLDEFRSTNITWDKATSRIYSPVTANASDENGRKLVVQIVNSGQVEDLTGATLHLYWKTRDKMHDGLDVFKAVDLKKGEFELSYTTGMLSNHGVLDANLVLIDTTGRVVSERFKITVTEGIDNDAIQSENSFSSLTKALIDISNLEQNYAPRLNDLTAQLQQIATLPKTFGAIGDGVTDDTNAFIDMLAYCDTSGVKTIRLTRGAYKVSNLTIPEGLTLIVDKGATFYIPNNTVLTINAEIVAGEQQIFDWDKGLTYSGETVTSISYDTWGKVEGEIKSNWIYPQWWGALADGMSDGLTGTDNYYAFKALSLYVNNAKKASITIPKGVYFFMQYDINQQMIEWLNLEQLTISGYGAKFDIFNSINRSNKSRPYGDLSLFQIKDCKKIVLEGFEINHNGDKATSSDNTNSASRSSIEFWRTKDVKIKDLSTRFGFSMGIAIWTDCADFIMDNVKVSNFSWGGLVIESLENGSFRNCEFNNGGRCGVMPRIPQSCGILIEAHGNTDNILFESCIARDSIGSQVYISNSVFVGTVRFIGGTIATSIDSAKAAFSMKCKNGIVDGVFFDLTNGGYIRALGYSTINTDKALYTRCTILTKSKGIEHIGDIGTLIIDSNHMIQIATAPIGTQFPFIQSSTTIFRNNYLFYPASLLDTASESTKVAVLHRAFSENNTFETDLSHDTKYLHVDLDGAKQIINNKFISPNNKSICANRYWDNNFAYTKRNISHSVYGDILGLSYNDTVYTIQFGGSVPTSGTYKRGEIVLNRQASVGGRIGWVCVNAGTPGTWKPFGAIDA